MTTLENPVAEDTFETRAKRIDTAQRASARLEADARDAAEELAAALEAHQGAVLKAIVTKLRGDDRGRELLYELVDEPEVFAALVKAGIVRPSLAMRAIQVLDGVRPYLTSHNGDVELVKIDGGVAYVRLLGACQSCGSATQTLRDSVAEALLENLPEITSVEEVAPDTAPTTTFIPVSALSFGRKAKPAP